MYNINDTFTSNLKYINHFKIKYNLTHMIL